MHSADSKLGEQPGRLSSRKPVVDVKKAARPSRARSGSDNESADRLFDDSCETVGRNKACRRWWKRLQTAARLYAMPICCETSPACVTTRRSTSSGSVFNLTTGCRWSHGGLGDTGSAGPLSIDMDRGGRSVGRSVDRYDGWLALGAGALATTRFVCGGVSGFTLTRWELRRACGCHSCIAERAWLGRRLDDDWVVLTHVLVDGLI